MVKKYFVDVLQENCEDYKAEEVIKLYLCEGEFIAECKNYYYRVIFDLFITEADLNEMEECNINNDIIEYLINYKARIDSEIIDRNELNNNRLDLIYDNVNGLCTDFNIEDYYYNR